MLSMRPRAPIIEHFSVQFDMQILLLFFRALLSTDAPECFDACRVKACTFSHSPIYNLRALNFDRRDASLSQSKLELSLVNRFTVMNWEVNQKVKMPHSYNFWRIFFFAQKGIGVGNFEAKKGPCLGD